MAIFAGYLTNTLKWYWYPVFRVYQGTSLLWHLNIFIRSIHMAIVADYLPNYLKSYLPPVFRIYQGTGYEKLEACRVWPREFPYEFRSACYIVDLARENEEHIKNVSEFVSEIVIEFNSWKTKTVGFVVHKVEHCVIQNVKRKTA